MQPDIRQELRKFAGITTVKGIGRTVRANNGVARTCWIVFLIVCFALLMFQVVTLLMNYYSYVVVQNTAVVQTPPNFPDITVCNLFPISDRKNFDDKYRSYLRKLDILRTHRKSPANLTLNADFWHYLRSLIIFNFNAIDYRIGEEDDPNEDGFVAESYQYQWDLYNGAITPLVLQHDRPLQKCIRITATIKDVALARMIFYVDDFWSDVINSFFSWTRMPMSTGVRVMVHARGTKPDTKTSIFVAPGSDMTITVKQANITRLLYPRGNCTDRLLMDPDRLDSNPYNQATCISLCRQSQTIQACQCLDPFEFFTEAQLKSVNGTFCLNITQFLSDVVPWDDSIVVNVWKMLWCIWYFIPVEEICDCPVPCTEVKYVLSVSGARWPSAVYQLAFYDRYIREDPHYAAKFTSYETLQAEQSQRDGSETLRRVRDLKLIEDNFLQVTVKMNDRSVTTVEDMLAMSWDTMASNLGGSLNLWLGISVLTAAEIIELLYSLIQILWNKKRAEIEVPRKNEDAVKPPE